MRKILTIVSAIALIGITAWTLCIASVPPIISYQGKLTQPSGAAVPDGAYSIKFAIYDLANVGNTLWSETNPNVQVKGGLFATMLGSVINLPANIFDNPNRWLGVTVESDPEMTPRQRIASVPYALSAGNGVPVGLVAMWSGSVNNIPTGWALCDGTNGTPNLLDKFVVGAGTGYEWTGSTYVPGAMGGMATINWNQKPHSHNIAPDESIHQHEYNFRYTPFHGAIVGADASFIKTQDYTYLGGWKDSQYVGYTSALANTGITWNADIRQVDIYETRGNTSVGQDYHTHGGATGEATSSSYWNGDIIENRPPYYAICFIMKLAQ